MLKISFQKHNIQCETLYIDDIITIMLVFFCENQLQCKATITRH